MMAAMSACRKLAAAMMLVVMTAACAIAQTPNTRSNLEAQTDATIVNNQSGQITPAAVNSLFKNIIASMITQTDTTNPFSHLPTFPCTGFLFGNGSSPATCTTSTVSTDSTLHVTSGNLGVNLGNTNTWTAPQTFSALQTINAGVRIGGAITTGNAESFIPFFVQTTMGNINWPSTIGQYGADLSQIIALDVSPIWPATSQGQTQGVKIEFRYNTGNYGNVNGGYNGLYTNCTLEYPTVLTNVNANYTCGQFTNQALRGDGGGATVTTGTNSAGQNILNVANGAVWQTPVSGTGANAWFVDDAGVLQTIHVTSVSGNALTLQTNLPNSASTGQSVTNYKGAIYSYSSYSKLNAGATYMLDNGVELDEETDAGASVAYEKVLELGHTGNNQVNGDWYSASLSFSDGPGALPAKNVIMLSTSNGQMPFNSNTCILCVVNPKKGAYTIGNGIDLTSNVTISGNFLNFKNGSWSGAGVLTTAVSLKTPLLTNTGALNITSTSASSQNIYVDFPNGAASQTYSVAMCSNTPSAVTDCLFNLFSPNTLTAEITMSAKTGNFVAKGTVTFPAFATAGAVINNASGVLSTSLGAANQCLTTNAGATAAVWAACGTAAALVIGTSSITGGSNGNIEFNNGGVLGEKAVTGSGSVVLASAPTISGLFTTQGGIKVAARVVSASTDTASGTTDYFLCVSYTSTGAVTETLPAGATGLTLLIKDCGGAAATNNITVTPAAGNIDGAATYVMSTNYQSIAVTYANSQWSVN